MLATLAKDDKYDTENDDQERLFTRPTKAQDVVES